MTKEDDKNLLKNKDYSTRELSELGSTIVNLMRQYNKELKKLYGEEIALQMMIRMLYMATVSKEVVEIETAAYEAYLKKQ